MKIQFPGPLFDLKDFIKHSDTFIETGTCVGDGVQRAIEAGFYHIKSVEIHKPYYEQAEKRFNGPNVDLFLGDTLKALPKMIGHFDKQLVIFLDAHPSGPGTEGHDDLMEKGELSEFHQDNIIHKEIEIIFKHRNDHVIMIDDMNGCNASSLKHMDYILSQNPNYVFSFYSQKLGENVYKEKILVCIP